MAAIGESIKKYSNKLSLMQDNLAKKADIKYTTLKVEISVVKSRAFKRW